MEERLEIIIKYLLIVVIILNSISLLVPWSEFNDPIEYGNADFYNWGAHRFSLNGTNNYTFYVSFLIPENLDNFFGIQSFQLGFIPLIFGILTIFFTACVIVFSIRLIFKNEYDKNNFAYLTIHSIFSVVSFYIFTHFGILSLPHPVSFSLHYSMGFIFACISIFLLFFIYLFFDYFSIEHGFTDKKTITPSDTIKFRYAKGEISKEEYEQLKRDLDE